MRCRAAVTFLQSDSCDGRLLLAAIKDWRGNSRRNFGAMSPHNDLLLAVGLGMVVIATYQLYVSENGLTIGYGVIAAAITLATILLWRRIRKA